MAIVIGGDPEVGKTMILDCFAEMKNSPNPHIPGEGSFNIQWEENGHHYGYSFWENDRSPLSYAGSHLILVFSVIDHESFDSIKSFWLPKFPDFFSRGTCILVGNKCDLRSKNPGSISSKMGAELMKDIGATVYIETSATTSENIPFIFSIIARNGISKSTNPSVIPFSDSFPEAQPEKKKHNYDTESNLSASVYQNYSLLQACYPTVYSSFGSSSYSNVYFYPYGYFS